MKTENNNFKLQGIIIWLICAVFYTYELLLRTVLGTFQQPIMQDLDLTPLTFAIMSTTCYLIVYSAMQMPAGFITEKYGLRKSLLVAISICGISGVCFAYTHDLKLAIFLRMLMGLGSSFGFVCLLISVYDWMPKKHYGFFVGLSQFIGLIGPMIAAGPLNSYALANATDWRVILFGLGMMGMILILFVLLYVKDSKTSSEKFIIIGKKTPITKSLYQLLSQHQIWLIAIYSALVYFTLEYLAENEGKAFLEMNGYSSSFSSYMITIGWVGCAIGSPVLGSLSDLFKRRKLIMALAAISSVISFIMIVYFPVSKAMLTFSFFMLGFSAGGQSIGFAIMAEQCSKAYLAIGLGFNNAMITLLMSINAPIVGGLLSYNGGEHLNVDAYRYAFLFIVALITLSVVLSVFFIKETYCRPSKGYTYINWLSFINSKKDISNPTA